MENKNTGLVVFATVLVMLVLVLGGYIVYDKVLNDKSTELPDASLDTKVEINYDNVNNLIADLKKVYEFVLEYDNRVIPYCGESKSSDKEYMGGNNYLESTQFTTYDEMYNYLRQYMSENMIQTLGLFHSSDKGHYLEENGKLYCATFAKGYDWHFGLITLELTNVTKNKIEAIAVQEKVFADTDNQYEKVKVTFEKENNNWIITSYKEIKD